MADWLKTIKNVMDAHSAWLFGGAVAAGLVAQQARKRRSFDADWFSVTCYGCGRSGFSDEMAEVTTPDGRRAYQCVRCQRPDLFRQAEGGHPSIDDDYYQVENHQCPRCKSMVTESDSCGGECAQCWACGCDCDAILAARIITNDPHDYEVDDYILIVDGTIREVAGNSQMDFFENDDNDWDQYQIAVITSVDPYTVEVIEGRYGNQTRASEDVGMIDIDTVRKVFEAQLKMQGYINEGGMDLSDFSEEEQIAWVTEILNNDEDECTCDDLPDDHPDWMKGMCESCYDRWASAWSSKDAEATNACPHCEGAAGFPREFYYQSDRIDMVPCGTCLTQGRCPGCMEIYPGLTRDNTPEDVFFNTGCTRCGYSESDARAARRTARRWVELVDNPAAAKFMAEEGRRYKGMPMKPLDRSDRGQNCDAVGCSQPVSRRRKTWGWVIGLCDACDELVDGDRYGAEDYGVGAVWMADTYDVAQHGSLLPLGSVKRFLSSMPTQQNFNVTFVKSNGEVRNMDALLTRPYNPDSLTCDVLEITGRGAVFKRFRVDRVIALYRV